jgi:hypothetical protein
LSWSQHSFLPARLLRRVRVMKNPLTPLIPLQVFSETTCFEFSLTTFVVISEFAGPQAGSIRKAPNYLIRIVFT